MSKTINIRPTTSVYSKYQYLSYDPWTAIAEFVDNSTQSYYDNQEKLEGTKYWNGLDISIEYQKVDGEYVLTITDNAYGMDFRDFQRAIILDSPPQKPTRSEFGMGLKTAACWFGKKWSVETTELGSPTKYVAEIDVEHLRIYKDEEITVEEIPCDKKEHGTVIKIWDLNRTMSSRQIGKTKNQLKGMYRCDLRTGKIHIFYNDDSLVFESPKLLKEELPGGNTIHWKKNISFAVSCDGHEYHVNGFIGILDEGSTSGAGFTLLRRGRVIIGGYEDGYRPEEIFEKSNSFIYQRLIGELNLDDWPVTQAKDGFDWYNGLEDLFIEQLLEECSDYRKKAKEYRKKKKTEIKPDFEKLVNNFCEAGIISNPSISEISDSSEEVMQNEAANLKESEHSLPGTNEEQNSTEIVIEGERGKRISFVSGEHEYIFNFVLKEDNIDARWLNVRTIGEEYLIEWNIRHPFFDPYISEPLFIEIMQQFTFALVLSEIEAKKTSTNGLIAPSTIRNKMNDTLKAFIDILR